MQSLSYTLSKDILTKPLEELSFVIFDLETTGGNPLKSGLTEVYGLEYTPGKEVTKTFHSMVNPRRRIPPIVRKITGITDQMVKDAPDARAVMPGFFDFIDGKILVSHNTLCDLKFLDFYSEKFRSYEIQNFFLCSHLLSEKLIPESKNKSLKGLCEHLAIDQNPNHRATEDTLSTLELFKVLLDKLKAQGIKTLLEAIRFQGDLASAIKIGWDVEDHEIKSIPNSLGTIEFKKESENLIFSIASTNCQRTLKILSELPKLPKGIARDLLKTKNLSYQKYDNILEANLESSFSFIEKKNYTLDIKGVRPPRVLGLSISEGTKGIYEVSISQVGRNNLCFFGPFFEFKEANSFLHFLAKTFFKKKLVKGKLLLQKSEFKELELLLSKNKLLFSLNSLKKSLVSLQPFRFFKHQRSLSKLAKTSKRFQNLENLRDTSGLLFVLNQHDKNTWTLYSISKGLISDTLTLETSYDTWLSTDEGSSFIQAFLSQQIENKSPVGKSLSQKEAHMMNLVLWLTHTRVSQKNKHQAYFMNQKELIEHSTS